MGILDDAIREHLELKRKHGVPEEELQREEDEALGPARREAAQQRGEDEPAPGSEGDQAAEAVAEQETDLFDMESDAAATPVEPPPVKPPPDEPALGDEPDVRDEPGSFEAPEDEEEFEDEPRPADEYGDEDEGDDEDLLSPEEEAAAESGDPDVLEDTPDFLQETPEHDRLWFEQKPPRDFDFD
jgi:hypothetical protein